MYVELTGLKEIQSAQSGLSSQLKKRFPHKMRRIIGYPSGYFEAEVQFAETEGEEVSWWVGKLYKRKNKKKQDDDVFINLFGRGDPKASNALLIDLQFNFSHVKFTRSHGGVFLRQVETGKIVLGHRGIVTRGKSRVPRELLLQEADVSPYRVASDVRPGKLDVLLVTPIDNPGIIDDIRGFATEIRRAASLVMNSSDQQSNPPAHKKAISKSSFLDTALKEYFEEFIGKITSLRAGGQVTMDCRHGAVVRALRDKLINQGTPYKSQAIDLAVVISDQILLFEVKTSTDTQSIYKAIGQLYVHGATLARQFQNKRVVRHLVLPTEPNKTVNERLLDELGIILVPFRLAGKNVIVDFV